MSDYRLGMGKRICDLRRRSGITQTQLAEMADISVHFMGQIGRGEASVSINTLVKLASCLKASTEYLLNGKGYEGNDVDNILLLLDMCGEEERKLLIQILKVFAR